MDEALMRRIVEDEAPDDPDEMYGADEEEEEEEEEEDEEDAGGSMARLGARAPTKRQMMKIRRARTRRERDEAALGGVEGSGRGAASRERRARRGGRRRAGTGRRRAVGGEIDADSTAGERGGDRRARGGATARGRGPSTWVSAKRAGVDEGRLVEGSETAGMGVDVQRRVRRQCVRFIEMATEGERERARFRATRRTATVLRSRDV